MAWVARASSAIAVVDTVITVLCKFQPFLLFGSYGVNMFLILKVIKIFAFGCSRFLGVSYLGVQTFSCCGIQLFRCYPFYHIPLMTTFGN